LKYESTDIYLKPEAVLKIVTLELKNDSDIDLVIALAKRLDGEILNIEQVDKVTTHSPVYWLNEIAKKGGVSSIKDPSEWQKEQRIYSVS